MIITLFNNKKISINNIMKLVELNNIRTESLSFQDKFHRSYKQKHIHEKLTKNA